MESFDGLASEIGIFLSRGLRGGDGCGGDRREREGGRVEQTGSVSAGCPASAGKSNEPNFNRRHHDIDSGIAK